jgi:hypothetical protein
MKNDQKKNDHTTSAEPKLRLKRETIALFTVRTGVAAGYDPPPARPRKRVGPRASTASFDALGTRGPLAWAARSPIL